MYAPAVSGQSYVVVVDPPIGPGQIFEANIAARRYCIYMLIKLIKFSKDMMPPIYVA